jgi:hypothetical protein
MRTQPPYLERIRSKYNAIGDVLNKPDRWHAWSKRQIEQEMLAVYRISMTARCGDPPTNDQADAKEED